MRANIYFNGSTTVLLYMYCDNYIKVIVVLVNQSVIVISPSATKTKNAKMFVQMNKLSPFVNGPNGHLSAHAVTPVTKVS